jgi:predicted transcriptional regulator
MMVNQSGSEFLRRDIHEQQRWRETEAALESARCGRVVSGETVHEWLDSWGEEAEKVPQIS